MRPEVYRSILESLDTGICILDRQRKITFWNDGAERITGYLRHEVIGRHCGASGLTHSDEQEVQVCASDCPVLEAMREGKRQSRTVLLPHRDGYRVPVWVHAVPVRDEDGRVIGVAESFEEKHPAAGAGSLAQHMADDGCLHDFSPDADDSLLASGLLDNLDEFSRRRIPFSLLCIQVDGAGQLSRTHGIQAAEKLAWVMAKSFLATLRTTDLVGRRGPDRLVVILAGCPEGAIMDVAERLQQLARLAAVRWWGRTIRATLSIGASAARPADTPDTILKRAEEALATCVSLGGNHVIVG
ncbi:MAG TPA: PAS domain-containing protein [Bryobacteraceae bacterium]|nr:PAS domain-containing protein [Bryobacteraceae bacterium]